MPSSTREGGAPIDSNSTTSVKRVRRVNRDGHESDSDVDSRSEHVLTQETSRKARRTKASKAATLVSETDQSGRKNSATQEVQQEALNNEIAPTKAPKKGRNRVKAKITPAEEEKEEEGKGDKVKEGTPKKVRKRRAANQEEGAEQAHDAPTPKKVKRPRKTKEEKEAEAMPLAARSIGLNMFVGAHVSGAKGRLLVAISCT